MRMQLQAVLGGCGNLAAILVLTACMVDNAKDDAALDKRLHRSTDERTANDPSRCRFSLGHGCLDGHIDAVQQFFVDGKEFFNANDLAARFRELLHVQINGKDADTSASGYKLTLNTPLDNESFISGFTYDLGGEVMRSGETRVDGNFSVDDLPAGNYKLRVQKTVKFDLVPPPPAATTPSSHVAAAVDPTAKAYCATLYADNAVTVREGQQNSQALNDFRLHITTSECGSGGNQTTINL